MNHHRSHATYRWFLTWSMAALLGLGCIRFFQHTAAFDFVLLDDDVNIFFNPHLGPPTLERLQWMWTDHEYVRRFIPLGWLGFSAIYALTGLNPVGYHEALIALHAVNAVLLFILLLRVQDLFAGLTPKKNWPVFSAWLTAAAWSVNPLAVETVAWASALLYAQALFCLLLALLVYSSLYRKDHGNGRHRELRVLLALFLYACSLLSYPIAAGVMPALIGLEYWLKKQRQVSPENFNGPRTRRFFRERAGFFAVSAAVLAITIYSRYHAKAWGEVPDLLSSPLSQRFAQTAYVLTYYLWKPWLPFDLSPIYTTFVVIDPGTGRFLASFGMILAVLLACVRWPYFRTRIAPCLAAYAGMMVPFFGMTERPHIPYDRYAILPSLFTALAGGLLLSKINASWLRGLAAAAVIIVTGIWAQLSYDQTWAWKNSVSLHQHIADKLADEEFPLFKFRRSAFVLFTFGKTQEAERVIKKGQARFPANGFIDQTARDFSVYRAYYDARSDIAGGNIIPLAIQHADEGLAAVHQRHWREGEEHFRRAMALAPNYYAASYNRALCLLELNRPIEALHWFLWAQPYRRADLAADSRHVFLERLSVKAASIGETKLADLAAKRMKLTVP